MELRLARIINPLRMQKVLIQGQVILLDEADIYLEERTMSDMERNSIVSGELISNLIQTSQTARF